MRPQDWKRITWPLLGAEWRWTKTFVYRVPVRWVAYGLLAEKSANEPDRFYLNLVRLPLYLPHEVLSLNWSDRYGGPSRTYGPDDAETSDALREAAARVTEEWRADQVLVDPPGGTDNVLTQEARAYGLLLQGNVGGATEVLGRVLRYEARYSWEETMLTRAREMRQLIESTPTRDAVRRLEVWRKESMDALGISAE